MPLIKSMSKKALGQNIATEMHAGKPQKQSIAIAYSVKKQAAKRKKMAQGGEITAADEKRPSTAATERSMAMELGARPSSAQELDARSESTRGNSIDLSDDEREMIMTHRRKMAEGGEVTANEEGMSSNSIDSASSARNKAMLDSKPLRHRDELLARDIGKPDEDSEDEMEMDMIHLAKGGSVADAIMAKRKKYADGGEVDLQDNSDEQLNEEDQLSFDAARKKTYFDDSQLDGQPEDSNEHADSEEADSEDEHDMISKIRSKMKSKRS